MKLKRLVTLFLAGVLVVSCMACSSDTTSTPTGETTQAPAEETTAAPAEEAAAEEEVQGMVDGTYTATAAGNASDISVTVTIQDNAITEITMEGNDSNHIQVEVERILPARIIEARSTAVDLVSGATMTSSAVLRAVRDCVAQAGGNLDIPVEHEATAETIDCDVVVVGAGLSGLTAANKLLSEGVNVVVIEQLDITGGTTRYAGGSMFGTLEPDYDPDEMAEKYGVMSSEKAIRMAGAVGNTFDFYRSIGLDVEYENPDTDPMRIKVFDASIGDSIEEGGYIWSAALERAYVNAGGTLLMGTKAVGIRTDENGAVVGIDAETDTGTLTINAPYTIMATGSPSGNMELLAIYCPTKADNEITQSSVGSDGTGIAMMLDLGAVVQEGWNAGLGIPYTSIQVGRSDREDYMSPLAVADALFVDYNGVRQTAESTGRIFSPAYDVVGKVDAYFTIFDSALAEKLGFTEALETGVAENTTHFFKADTLEELAALAGFDEATFVATVEEYNGYCEAGEDVAFGKKAENLNAIAEGPYYAVKHELMALEVTGGIVTSDSFEVIGQNGEPIPGIYAIGATTVRDMVGFAGGSNLACGAYMALTAAESIIDALK